MPSSITSKSISTSPKTIRRETSHNNKNNNSQEENNLSKMSFPSGCQCQSKILEYKEKAHKSFMQVIQVQQLHEEEMSQIKEEFQTTQDQLKEKIINLQSIIEKQQTQLALYEKNSKRHYFSTENDNALLNLNQLEQISCKDEGNSMLLSENSLLGLNQFIQGNHHQEKIYAIRKCQKVFKKEKEIGEGELISKIEIQELKKQLFKNIKNITFDIKKSLQKIFQNMSSLRQFCISLNFKNVEFIKKIEDFQLSNKSMKKNMESLKRDNTFLTQNFKRISDEKLNLEKRINSQVTVSQTRMNNSRNKLSSMIQKIQNIEETIEKKSLFREKQAILEVSSVENQVSQLNYAMFLQCSP